MFMQNKIRWGVLGCAGIAVRKVIPAIQESETGVVTAIASRQEDNAKEWAGKLNIPNAYGSYEKLLADPDIDAVYIPLPNHLHKEWTVKAAQAGKHVLCEKPAALDAEETKEMVAACEAAGVRFAEAFMYRFHPRYERIKQLIADGEIGEVRGIHGVFTFNNAKGHGNVRFRKEWGGGSIYDVGVYPISAARFILEQEPVAATAHAFFSPEHDDVDMMASGLLEFEGGVALTFDCGMWAAGRNTLEIVGTEGRIELASAFVAGGSNDGFQVIRKGETRTEEVPAVNQYSLQADDFGRSILDGRATRFAPEDAVNNMRVVDACLKSARERIRVQL